MTDYNALKALDAVIELQSFEQASKKLAISQSAVSQRIQSFETYLGNKLLIRKSPYSPTEIGEQYLSLLRKVSVLEDEIINEQTDSTTLKLAINRDSLDLYFSEILKDTSLAETLTLQIIADDQANTINYLKSGQVDMCISSQEKALPNHTSTFLGNMKYILVCSKEFYKKHFSKSITKAILKNAPLVVFDNSDKLQHTFLNDEFGVDSFNQINFMPTVTSFKNAILGGYGYGLLPELDVTKELKNKSLVKIERKKSLKIPLYLHQWEYQNENNKLFTEKLINASKCLS